MEAAQKLLSLPAAPGSLDLNIAAALHGIMVAFLATAVLTASILLLFSSRIPKIGLTLNRDRDLK